MYIGVDVGGTKTLLAVLNDDGVIQESTKFATPQNYDHWLLELKHAAQFLGHKDFKACGIGIPGDIDRRHGRGIKFGNLPWRNVPVQYDVERAFNCPTVVENDAKMACLSEAMLLKDKYQKVLYLTISTGIGMALVDHQKIVTDFGDRGGKGMLLEHQGKLVPWESYASGKAIYEKYGQKAKDITDEATWKAIVRNLVPGFLELIAMYEPDVVIVGGGVGTYFSRYKKILTDALKEYETPALKIPPLRKAARPEEAVIYGCYDLAKQTFSHGTTTK